MIGRKHVRVSHIIGSHLVDILAVRHCDEHVLSRAVAMFVLIHYRHYSMRSPILGQHFSCCTLGGRLGFLKMGADIVVHALCLIKSGTGTQEAQNRIQEAQEKAVSISFLYFLCSVFCFLCSIPDLFGE